MMIHKRHFGKLSISARWSLALFVYSYFCGILDSTGRQRTSHTIWFRSWAPLDSQEASSRYIEMFSFLTAHICTVIKLKWLIIWNEEIAIKLTTYVHHRSFAILKNAGIHLINLISQKDEWSRRTNGWEGLRRTGIESWLYIECNL